MHPFGRILIGLWWISSVVAAAAPAAKNSCSLATAQISSDQKQLENIPFESRELRFALPFQKLQASLNSSMDPDRIIKDLSDNDLRFQVFILEAEGRDYENAEILTKKERQAFRKFNDKLERLENMLGNYADSKNYLKTAEELSDSGYPDLEKIIAWLTDYREQLHKDFKKLLEDDGWLPNDPRYLANYAKVTKIFSKIKPREDNNNLLSEIAHQLEKDAKKTFDITNLEEGIHPLRRHLRWFMLKARSTNGLVQLRKTRGKTWTSPFVDPKKTAKYSELPFVGTQNQVAYLDRPLYESITNMVEVLGLAKDTGQFTQIYTKAYLETNPALTTQQAEALAAKLVAARPKEVNVDPSATADEIQKYLKAHKVRERIAKQLRAAIR